MPKRPALRTLAERLGILSGYRSAEGRRRETPDETREALVAALGHDGSSEAAAARCLAALAPERGIRRTPERGRAAAPCLGPRELLGGRLAFGIWTNLYTLRGTGALGVGSFSDLETLARCSASAGAAFVGVNPLHAVRYRDREVSPYSPLTRFFRSPLYLDLRRIPEWEHCPPARALFDSPRLRRERERLAAAPRIDYEAARALQAELLRPLHATFTASHDGRPTPRGRAWLRFRKRADPLLRDLSTFLALEEQLARDGHPRDWRRWPEAFRSSASPAVEAFRGRHRQDVDFHAWVQFEIDRQLAASARHGRQAGLSLGLYQDLALGSVASGFDTWAFPQAFATGASLGAPPDRFAPDGQDWGLPPLDPQRVGLDDFGLWRRLLRAAFEHAGALRIDHILGLFRQWWVPAGRPASEGAYLRFPSEDLLRVLAEESRRAGALVIGEDLGTVPPQVAPTLARFGVLSSRVMLFERDRAGRFRSARRYSPRALATANTHDLPTLGGFWQGRDLEIQRQLGGLADDASLARAQADREGEKRALRARLVADGHLPRSLEDPSPQQLCAAVSAFLCSTPCPLVGISLDDLAGELEPVNVPGASLAVYPSWTRRMSRPLAELVRDASIERTLAAAAARAARRQ